MYQKGQKNTVLEPKIPVFLAEFGGTPPPLPENHSAQKLFAELGVSLPLNGKNPLVVFDGLLYSVLRITSNIARIRIHLIIFSTNHNFLRNTKHLDKKASILQISHPIILHNL